MRARLRKAWESRAPRERRTTIALAIILSVTLYGWLVTSADRARAQLRSSIPVLRGQATILEQHASELERLRAAPRPSINPVDLRVLMQTQADALGISHAEASIIMQTPDQVQVTLSAVPFEDWLNLVGAMQLQHVRLDSSRMAALSAPGMVSVTATFVRIGMQ
ncbi:MAG: type II secretion system protein M [Betaproteobacteria bacterium]|nr:type II secretion system protein M [Betaproteobacteria bacterium]